MYFTIQSRAVKLAEKLNLNFLLKYYQNSNYILNSFREKKAFGFSPEGASSKILPNTCFFKVGLGNMSKNSYLCIFGLICSIRYKSLYFGLD